MSRYVSRRGSLYLKVLILLMLILGAVFAFVVYLMPTKIKITKLSNIEGLVFDVTLVNKGEPLSERNLYDIIVNQGQSRVGYRFDAWYLTAEARDLRDQTKVLKPTDAFEKNTTIYGYWEPYNYDIKFEVNEIDKTEHFDPSIYDDIEQGLQGDGFWQFGSSFELPSGVINSNYTLLRVSDTSGLEPLILSGWNLVSRDPDIAPHKFFAVGEVFNLVEPTDQAFKIHYYIRNNPLNPDNANYSGDDNPSPTAWRDVSKGSFVFTPVFKYRTIEVQFGEVDNPWYWQPKIENYNDGFVRLGETIDSTTRNSKGQTLPVIDGVMLAPYSAYDHMEFEGWYKARLDNEGNIVKNTEGKIMRDTQFTAKYNFTNGVRLVEEKTVIYPEFKYKNYTVNFDLSYYIPSTVTDNPIWELNSSAQSSMLGLGFSFNYDSATEGRATTISLQYNPNSPTNNGFIIPYDPPYLVGYKFIRWAIPVYDASGQPVLQNGKIVFEINPFNYEGYSLTKNITLYAVWEEQDITDNPNHPSLTDPERYFTFSNNNTVVTGLTDAAHRELDSIIFPDSVTSINANLFDSAYFDLVDASYKSRIKTIIITKNITNISTDAFVITHSSTSGLNHFAIEEIIVDTENPKYRDIEGVLYEKINDDFVFKLLYYPRAKSAESYTIGRVGSNVQEIADNAFNSSFFLKNVTVNVAKIGNNAFKDSKSLLTVKLTAKVNTGQLGYGAFTNTPITTFNISENSNFLEDTTKNALYYKYDGSVYLYYYKHSNVPVAIYTSRSDTTYVAREAFYGAKNILKIVLTDRVRQINQSAFEKSSITELEIKGLGEFSFNIWQTRIFFDAVNLTTVKIEGVNAFGSVPSGRVFNNNIILKDIYINTNAIYARDYFVSLMDDDPTPASNELNGVTLRALDGTVLYSN